MMATWINSGWPFLIDQGIQELIKIAKFDSH